MIRPSPLKKRTKKKKQPTSLHWQPLAPPSWCGYPESHYTWSSTSTLWGLGVYLAPGAGDSSGYVQLHLSTFGIASHITTLGAAQVPNLPHPSSLPRSSRSRLDSNHGPCRMLGALTFDTRSMFYVQSSIGHVDEGCCRFQKHLLHLTQYGPEGFWHPSNPMGLSWHLAPRQHEGTWSAPESPYLLLLQWEVCPKTGDSSFGAQSSGCKCRNIPTRTMYVRRYVRTYYTYVCLSIACIAACMYVKEGMYYMCIYIYIYYYYYIHCIHLYVDPLAYIVILCGNIYMSIFMITRRSMCGI